jgi:hypothetical protein
VKTARPIGLLAGLVLAALPAGAAPSLRATATLSLAENISRTSDPRAERDATTLDVGASATVNRQLARDWFAWATADAGHFTDFDFKLTNRSRLGVGAGLRRKFGLGPQAPMLDLNAGLSRRFARYEGATGWVADAGARFSQRVGDTLHLALTGEWQQVYARHGAFDTRHQQAGFDAAWDFADGWLASAGLGRLWGDVVANATGPTYARALAGDFGSGVQSYYSAISYETNQLYGPNWVSYRVHAHGDSAWFALARDFSDSTSLTLRVWSIKVINQVNIRYDSEFWSLTLAHRF